MTGSAWDAVRAIEETPVPHEAGQMVTLKAADAHALSWGFRCSGEAREAEAKTLRRLRELLETTEKAMEAQLALNHSLRLTLEAEQARADDTEKALRSLEVRYNGVEMSATVAPARVTL